MTTIGFIAGLEVRMFPIDGVDAWKTLFHRSDRGRAKSDGGANIIQRKNLEAWSESKEYECQNEPYYRK